MIEAVPKKNEESEMFEIEEEILKTKLQQLKLLKKQKLDVRKRAFENAFNNKEPKRFQSMKNIETKPRVQSAIT